MQTKGCKLNSFILHLYPFRDWLTLLEDMLKKGGLSFPFLTETFKEK